MRCSKCDSMDCYQGKDCTSIAERCEQVCDDPHIARTMGAAATIESTGYGELNRLEEVALFAQMMEYERLGLAFCIGLSEEARRLDDYLDVRGFRVFSVCCKLCGLSKEQLGLKRLHPDWQTEATCNPVGQALQLERCRTDLNIVVGLCVGHDVLFTQHSHAPLTTLVVKDRVLAHSPCLALYTRYGRKKLGI